MKIFIKKTVLTTLLILGFNNLYAEQNTNHTLSIASQSYIKKVAKKEVDRLISVKAIDKSWQDKPISSMETKKFDETIEWVVKYNNKQIKENNKQTLYIFITVNGVLVGTNYTGE